MIGGNKFNLLYEKVLKLLIWATDVYQMRFRRVKLVSVKAAPLSMKTMSTLYVFQLRVTDVLTFTQSSV